jgi:hypothetical protein
LRESHPLRAHGVVEHAEASGSPRARMPTRDWRAPVARRCRSRAACPGNTLAFYMRALPDACILAGRGADAKQVRSRAATERAAEVQPIGPLAVGGPCPPPAEPINAALAVA